MHGWFLCVKPIDEMCITSIPPRDFSFIIQTINVFGSWLPVGVRNCKKKLHKGEITAFSWKIPTVVYEQIGMAQRCNVAFYFNDEDKPVVESYFRVIHIFVFN